MITEVNVDTFTPEIGLHIKSLIKTIIFGILLNNYLYFILVDIDISSREFVQLNNNNYEDMMN